MNLSLAEDYEILQSFEEFQKFGPLLSSSKFLLEEAKQKMPEDEILKYSKSKIGQEDNSSLSNLKSVTTNIPEKELPVTPIYHFKLKQNTGRAISLQKWQGIVTQIFKDSFYSDLINLTHEGFDEETEFSIEEVSPEDQSLIEVGAIFYWSIGYHHSYSGQRTRMSQIRFKRMPNWSKKAIEMAEKKAKKTATLFGWND